MDITLRRETWPIRDAFRISRGAKTAADVIVAEARDGGAVGRGEAVPYARYGETAEAALKEAEAAAARLSAGAVPADAQALLPAGAARSALDCALWDLAAKRDGLDIAEAFARALGAPVAPRRALETAFTISLDEPARMADAARRAAERPLLKLKLGDPDSDLARVRAVRKARPDARLIVDANEGWTLPFLQQVSHALAEQAVALVEQPLPADGDDALEGWASPVLLCADESVHLGDDLAAFASRYGAVNVKLDKSGGVTAALDLVRAARSIGLQVMVGCMVGTSLAMAPACRLAEACRAEFVDLDGPLLLARDRAPGLAFDGATIAPCPTELWG